MFYICLTKVICKQKINPIENRLLHRSAAPCFSVPWACLITFKQHFQTAFWESCQRFSFLGKLSKQFGLPSLFFLIWTLNNWCFASSSAQFNPFPPSLISQRRYSVRLGWTAGKYQRAQVIMPEWFHKKQHIDYHWLYLSVLQLLNFIFLGKRFTIPELRGAFGTFFNTWSLGETWPSTELKSSLLNANLQADVTPIASLSNSIAQLIFHSVIHRCNYRSFVTHADCTCVSICMRAHLWQ